ncbi:hypothetical protein GUJ93_ZPchr0012g21437 [Zizania palustris]|uniref:Uncharacterized protein n=1 Tax=Zizania palustris TaxID=103762 RepID=A0A8J5WNM7_ZIZPA|nr:hypothetical protein GUJ93_ZPchr0012g21437 [Zizania palustris]
MPILPFCTVYLPTPLSSSRPLRPRLASFAALLYFSICGVDIRHVLPSIGGGASSRASSCPSWSGVARASSWTAGPST